MKWKWRSLRQHWLIFFALARSFGPHRLMLLGLAKLCAPVSALSALLSNLVRRSIYHFGKKAKKAPYPPIMCRDIGIVKARCRNIGSVTFLVISTHLGATGQLVPTIHVWIPAVSVFSGRACSPTAASAKGVNDWRVKGRPSLCSPYGLRYQGSP